LLLLFGVFLSIKTIFYHLKNSKTTENVHKSAFTLLETPISKTLIKTILLNLLTNNSIVFAVLLLLGYVSSGSLGAHNLSKVGVEPWKMSSVIISELIIGQLIAFGIWVLYRQFRKTKVKVHI
jgi:hypothetical protein